MSSSTTTTTTSGSVQPTTGPTAAFARPAHELSTQLAGLHEAMRKLAEVAREKLAALRAADAVALHRCAGREGELLSQVFRQQQGRNATIARLAQSLRLPDPGRARLAEVTANLPEPLASSLRARGVALREVAEELQRGNKIAAAVAHNLQEHLSGIFAELAGAAQESQVYGPQGQHEPSTSRCWVDAVG